MQPTKSLAACKRIYKRATSILTQSEAVTQHLREDLQDMSIEEWRRWKRGNEVGILARSGILADSLGDDPRPPASRQARLQTFAALQQARQARLALLKLEEHRHDFGHPQQAAAVMGLAVDYAHMRRPYHAEWPFARVRSPFADEAS